MNRTIITLATLLLLGTGYAADKPKNIYKVTHLSTTEVGISCLNGADPTGRKFGDVVIMSCGKE
jgi:hypothetical protein